MNEALGFWIHALLIGLGATLIMDLWALLQKRLFGIPSLNYAMVGRWVGYFPRGQFKHQNIGQSEPIKGEAIIGWSLHYIIGVIFAAILLAIWGLGWAHHPTIFPALIIGIATIAAPFFMMQPGMGAGIAASKTPQPNVMRRRSLIAHASFGIGLYLSAIVLSLFLQP
ncbi:DUF2938 domain-containing protein [Algicola sagamiensis]|uniref:DUF2938 domain-containing protein n=1 Tax=Algicola sagamiensis TaxID=163869 RepID=UPI00036975F3|nr:DUF2938 domain-containing protein [Algicola sagamiensis]